MIGEDTGDMYMWRNLIVVEEKSLYGGQLLDERITNEISELSNSCKIGNVSSDCHAKKVSIGV